MLEGLTNQTAKSNAVLGAEVRAEGYRPDPGHGVKIHRHFHTPSSRALTEIYAWVLTEPDGSEGIVMGSVPTEDGSTLRLPLIGGDLARMSSLRRLAEQARAATGFPVRLMRFSTRTVLEELEPGRA